MKYIDINIIEENTVLYEIDINTSRYSRIQSSVLCTNRLIGIKGVHITNTVSNKINTNMQEENVSNVSFSIDCLPLIITKIL